MTTTNSSTLPNRKSTGPATSFTFTIQTDEFRSQPLPGFSSEAKISHCFVRVTDLPTQLDDFMEVNPRVPSRNKKDILTGPVIKGILTTLRESPKEMVLKNQGMYLLVEACDFKRAQGGRGELTINMSDRKIHGLVNGGHSYAAIREAIENAESYEVEALKKAFVQLHILQGIEEDYVSSIAEGLNTSKQVDDWSLFDLDGKFDDIRRAMKGKLGEKAIAYHQGDEGDIYISDVVVMLEMFNRARYDDKKHPSRLYRRSGTALKLLEDDSIEKDGLYAPTDVLIPKVHEILSLADKIKAAIPDAAERNNFEFGRLKIGNAKGKERAGSDKHKNTPLPFIGQTMSHRIPNGWVLPMLAAFRANLKWDQKKGVCEWITPINKVLQGVIDELVHICVVEHRDNNVPPEQVGKRESVYRSCYKEVELFLSKNR